MAVFESLFEMALAAACSFPSTVSVLIGSSYLLEAFVEDIPGECMMTMGFYSFLDKF
jgi:hypothetical protein